MDNPPEREAFAFREIKLLKSEVLGAGSYGKVCRALCDGLPCAAKIIHSTLFDLTDPGAASFMRRFDEECRLLSRVRHPNVVLYLTTYSDPETNLPVLLMELCDNSLTKVLEHAPGSLDYHIECNITHDIALALVYLHANQVIHRDLTSNNVLMITGCRAKVTDFGMSRLVNVNPRMTPLTQCPGNLLYMSPEALDEEPRYTKKLDIFSLGVLVVQILTRQFPNPTARFSVVDVSQDSRFGSKTVNVPVKEIERRSEHLKLICDSHPLKMLALDCLKDVEKERPSALDISTTLHDIKQSQDYKESVASSATDRISTPNRERINSLRKQVKELKQKEIKQQQKLSHQQREFESHKLEKLEREIQRLNVILKEREKELGDVREFKETEKALRAIVDARDRELQASQLAVVQAQQTLQQKDREIGNLRLTITSLRQCVPNQPVHRQRNLPGKAMKSPPQATHNPDIVIRLDGNFTAPYAMKRGAAVVNHNMAFITPEASKMIYQFTSGVNQWAILPEHPFESIGLVVLPGDGCVSSIGGWNGTTFINQLLTLSEDQSWVFSRYPAMPTARIEAAIVCSQHVLVVAGGYNGQNMLDTVEVLTLYNMQWARACQLLHPFYMACGSLCGGQLYLAGGYMAQDVKSKSVLTCSLMDLLHSSPSLETGVSALSVSDRGHQLWRETGQLPYTKCTLAAQRGRLLAVGGKDDQGQANPGIFTYNPSSETWTHISNLATPRNQCFALSLPGDAIYIIGGDPKIYSIEIMTVM